MTPGPPTTAGFDDFVRSHTDSLVRTAYLLTGNSHEAEELVQEALVKLYPQWHRVEAAELPLAYVRRTVTNTFISANRRGWAREVRYAHVPDRARLDAGLAAVDERDVAWSLLQRLPARQRAVLVLRFFHDWTDDDIAAALGCRPGTVRSLLSRGLASIRAGSPHASAAHTPTTGAPTTDTPTTDTQTTKAR